MQTINSEQLENLRADLEEKHTRYSEAFAAREAAERAQADVAARRASLVARCATVEDKLRAADAAAIEAAVSGECFAEAGARFAELRNQFEILRRARIWYDLYTGADAERETLVARLNELIARHAAEAARKAAHEAEVLLSIGRASSVAGGLTVEGLGPVADELARIVESARGDVVSARQKLEEHDTVTRLARQQFNEQETS